MIASSVRAIARVDSSRQRATTRSAPVARRVARVNPSVTGANGLLDRVDALCFAAPVFFHSVRWYFGV